MLIASSTDPSVFSAFNASGELSTLLSIDLGFGQSELALRFTTDDAPPAGVVEVELHAASLLGLASAVVFDNVRFEREAYGDLKLDATGRFGEASHRVSVTASQAAPSRPARVVAWTEP